jgi:uncharacterized phiE125 gp8 family phage protein
MTIDQMRAVLGLDPSVPDADVVQAYVIYLESLPQAAEPLSTEEAKAQLGLTTDIDDPLIAGLIIAAREYAENYTGLVLTAREVVEMSDRFGRWNDLSSWPVREITSIEYLDEAGTAQTIDASGYVAALLRRPVRISASVGATWPTTAHLFGAVTITVQAGYASPDLVPQSVKQAMLLLIRHWYDNPAAVMSGAKAAAMEVPLGTTALLDPHRLQVV